MEIEPHIRVSTGGGGDQTQDPWEQGEWFIHYTTAAPHKLAPMLIPECACPKFLSVFIISDKHHFLMVR